MKATAEKSSTTTSPTATQTASQPFFAKAGSGGFFAPATPVSVPGVQMKLSVNKPGDKFEQEADRMADKVMRMPAPALTEKGDNVQRQPDRKLPNKEDQLQRKSSDGIPTVGASIQSAIQNKTTGGQPLSTDVRSYMEPRFGADFSQVRVHNDVESVGLSNQLSARAFTYQNHVFFSRDQYQPGTSEGKQLLAHELTHTIQQGHAIQRSPQVSTTTTPPPIQRLGTEDALGYFANAAYAIPGFRLLTLVIGFNPITRQATDRSASNLLRALVELMPGGYLVGLALDNYGLFNKAGAWVEQKIAAFMTVGASITASLTAFISSLNPLDLVSPGGLWERAKRIFTSPIGQLISFAGSAVGDLLHLVKTAILKPLASLAEGTAGYDLLKALLGEDPITGEAVPRNADTLLGGFMKLIGQEEIWQNLKKGNAVARAWAWFQGALAGLLGFARSIPQRVMATLAGLTFPDVLTVASTFARVAGNFAGIAGEFLSWGLNQVISLLEILFSVVAPGVIPYIKKAQGAFQTILRNPIGFVGNLVQAGKLGFIRFANGIAGHLMQGLLKWLTAPMAAAGIYVLKSFSLPEVLKMVASALGLTWPNIRKKLLKIIPEPVLAGLEKTAGILVTFVQQGPAAALEQIKAELTELKDQLISQIIEMVTSQVVQTAVTKLVSLFNPAGAVIQAILAIYNTVSVFINQLGQIAAVAAAFIDSIAAIAAGQLDGAAKKVEQTMASILPIVIAFFAKFAGAGSIPDKLFGLVMKGQKFVDKGIDKVVAWLGGLLKKLGALAQKGLPEDPKERLQLGLKAATAAVKGLTGNRISRTLILPVLAPLKLRFGFTILQPEVKDGNWWVYGKINPTAINNTNVEAQSTSPTDLELVVLVRRVVLEEVRKQAAVMKLRKKKTRTGIKINRPIDYVAAALHAREKSDSYKKVWGSPRAAWSYAGEAKINLGGGIVRELRARTGNSPLETVIMEGIGHEAHYGKDIIPLINNSGISAQNFAKHVNDLTRHNKLSDRLSNSQKQLIRQVTWLLHGPESARSIANIAHAPMIVDMIKRKELDWNDALSNKNNTSRSGGMLPATMAELPKTVRELEKRVSHMVPGLQPRHGTTDETKLFELVEREAELVRKWAEPKIKSLKANQSLSTYEKIIRNLIRDYYRLK